MARVFCDVVPAGSAAPVMAYLFEQTIPNQKSVLDAALSLWNKRRIKIGITEHKKIPNFSVFGSWRRYLCSRGVKSGDVIAIAAMKDFNTLGEARNLVRFAKARRLKSICIIASPFHQLRAFITTVSVLMKELPELRVYNVVGEPLDWDTESIHSGGILRGARSDFLKSEWERIGRYYKKGDLVSLANALAYIEKRDKN